MSPDTLVADSFLVDHGRVLRLDAHAERFARDAARAGFPAERAAAALMDLARSAPSAGVWFPRIDLLADHTLETQLRPAPARGGEVRMVTADRDPRTRPGVKGPDLERMVELRRWAVARGADEAVVTVDGLVCDGALSALAWWRDDCLFVPAPALTRVDSVTAGWLVESAEADGVRVERVCALPAEVAGAEVWVMSALHGIRPVVGWIDGPQVARATRQQQWQRRWLADRVPVRG